MITIHSKTTEYDMDIEKQVSRIWFKNIFKSYLWLIFPIALLGCTASCESYIEAGTHLTNASVSVRGYYRKDGTYVRPYNRRPPGGAVHDKPFETTRTLMSFLFFVSLVGGCSSIFVYIEMSREDANELIHKYKEEQERKRIEAKRKEVVKILSAMKFDFLTLSRVPYGLILGGVFENCKFCNSYLYNKDYYISYYAIKHTHYICIDCLKKRDSLGRGQPSDKYADALEYTILLSRQFEIFLNKFFEQKNASESKFTREEIKKIFIDNIKLKILDLLSKQTPIHYK